MRRLRDMTSDCWVLARELLWLLATAHPLTAIRHRPYASSIYDQLTNTSYDGLPFLVNVRHMVHFLSLPVLITSCRYSTFSPRSPTSSPSCYHAPRRALRRAV